jgi:hypothetical protein
VVPGAVNVIDDRVGQPFPVAVFKCVNHDLVFLIDVLEIILYGGPSVALGLDEVQQLVNEAERETPRRHVIYAPMEIVIQ